MQLEAPSRPSEREVGISEYLQTTVRGFDAVFKENWEDFHVHEVDVHGVELHLSEVVTAEQLAAQADKSSATRRFKESLGAGFSPEPEAEAALHVALGVDLSQELFSFLRKQQPVGSNAEQESLLHSESAEIKKVLAGQDAASEELPPAFVDLNVNLIGDGTKEARKLAHQTILKFYGSVLSTDTVDGEAGMKCIRVWNREAEKTLKPAVDRTSDGKGGKGGKGSKKGKKGKAGEVHGKGNKSLQKSETAGANSQGDFGTFRHRAAWPKDRPHYLHFRLYKENCDTAEALARIAQSVRRPIEHFTVHGNKDRRAVTVQQVCAYKLYEDQLKSAMLYKSWDQRLRVSDLKYGDGPLKLGAISGNRFYIALRGVVDEVAMSSECQSEGLVGQAFTAASTAGFLNYFGLQRFGTHHVPTHRVGAAILASRWEEAVNLIMGGGKAPIAREFTAGSTPAPEKRLHKDMLETCTTPTDDSLPPLKIARVSSDSSDAATKPSEHVIDAVTVTLEEGSLTDASDVLPSMSGDVATGSASRVVRPKWQLVREAQCLFLQQGDVQGALEAMPRSQHLERCVLGALAEKNSHVEALKQLPSQSLSLYVHAAASLVWNYVLSRRIKEFGTKPVVGDLVLADSASCMNTSIENMIYADEDGRSGLAPAVKSLSCPEEAALSDMADVVLPLPGKGATYPPHLKSAYEDAACNMLGISLEDFHASSLVPLHVAFRHIVVRPGGLQWQIVQPTQLKEMKSALLQTDVMRLQSVSCNSGSGVVTQTKCQGEDASPKSTPAAVVFNCMLRPSAYLTMLLREVMKRSTASSE